MINFGTWTRIILWQFSTVLWAASVSDANNRMKRLKVASFFSRGVWDELGFSVGMLEACVKTVMM